MGKCLLITVDLLCFMLCNFPSLGVGANETFIKKFKAVRQESKNPAESVKAYYGLICATGIFC